MKEVAVIAATVMLAACASTPSQGANEGPQTDAVAVGLGASGAADIRVTHDAYATAFDVPVARDSLFDLLPEAFDGIGLPAPALDRAGWTAAVRDHTVQRRLNGERLSRMFECGAGPAGRYADTRRIEMDVTVRLQPDDAGTRVATDVVAYSYDPSGRTPNTDCVSRGVLERMIADALAEAAAD